MAVKTRSKAVPKSAAKKKYNDEPKRVVYDNNTVLKSSLKHYYFIATVLFCMFYFSKDVSIRFSPKSFENTKWEYLLHDKSFVMLNFHSNINKIEATRYEFLVNKMAQKYAYKFSYLSLDVNLLENGKMISMFRIRKCPTTYLLDLKSGYWKKLPLYSDEVRFKEGVKIFIKQCDEIRKRKNYQ
jgi:hypothetical protein